MKAIIAIIAVVVMVGAGYLLLYETESTNTNSSTQNTQVAETNSSTITNTTMKEKNIVQTAIEAGSFKTLVSAIQAADLVDTLSGPGPFTVFAPTDAAFEKLPAGTLDSLLENKEELAKILAYHVVSGEVMAKDVTNGMTAKTVQGSTLTFNTSNGVKVNNATVTAADVNASNGVIHVIDTVLIPSS